MLVTKKLPKRRVIETIPEDLKSYLEEVLKIIKTKGLSDISESKPVLDRKTACGYISDKDIGLFRFYYYPERNETKSEWKFELFLHEIEAVVNKQKETIAFWACENEDCKYRTDAPDFFCSKDDQYDDGKPLDNTESWERIRKLREAREAEEKDLS